MSNVRKAHRQKKTTSNFARHAAPPDTEVGLLERLGEGVARLREVGSPLAEPTVAAFEQHYGIRLPAAYRTFLLHIGDGAKSEWSYRLFDRLEEIAANIPWPWQNLEHILTSFEGVPYRNSWGEHCLTREEQEAGRTYAQQEAEELDEYHSVKAELWEQIRRGTLPLQTSCTYIDAVFLVVQGSERGNVWHLQDDLYPDGSWAVRFERLADFVTWVAEGGPRW